MTGRPLKYNVAVVDEAHQVTVLEAGSEVPKWAADQVGDHCFEQDETSESKPARKPRQRSTESE